MSIEWESILPIKQFVNMPSLNSFVEELRRNTIIFLKAAEARGEICKPLSVSEILSIMYEYACDDEEIKAEAIHRAMTNKESK